jgi:hypothetical protein
VMQGGKMSLFPADLVSEDGWPSQRKVAASSVK